MYVKLASIEMLNLNYKPIIYIKLQKTIYVFGKISIAFTKYNDVKIY